MDVAVVADRAFSKCFIIVVQFSATKGQTHLIGGNVAMIFRAITRFRSAIMLQW